MKKRKPNVSRKVVEVRLTHAIELYHRDFAEIATGEIKLTAAGRKALGKAAVGVRLVIAGFADKE